MFSEDPPQPVAPGKMANRQARITAQYRACLKNPASARQHMIPPMGSARSVRRPGVFFVRDAALCRQESRCRRSGRKAELLDFEPRFQSPQGPAQMHRRRARSSRVDRLDIARPAQSVTRMGAGRSSDLRAQIAGLLTDPIPPRMDRQWGGMRLPSGARSQRRGRSGFAPDSLFTGLGRLPFRSPAPRDYPDLKGAQPVVSRMQIRRSSLA
jgi:hypothetical protein